MSKTYNIVLLMIKLIVKLVKSLKQKQGLLINSFKTIVKKC